MEQQRKRTIPHRERKNPGMREKYQKLRHEANAKRPKQVWVSLPAHWERA